MNPFILDNYLLAQFQRFSDWLQDVTGKTCFWFATICLFGSILAGAYNLAIDMHTLGWKLGVRFAIATVFFFWTLWLIERTKSKVSANRMFMNPLKGELFPVRMMFFFNLILTTWNLAWGAKDYFYSTVAGDVFNLLMIYFMSCNPRPWSKNMVGKWLDALSHALFGGLAPQGA